jgi:hypothetical protein
LHLWQEAFALNLNLFYVQNDAPVSFMAIRTHVGLISMAGLTGLALLKERLKHVLWISEAPWVNIDGLYMFILTSNKPPHVSFRKGLVVTKH